MKFSTRGLGLALVVYELVARKKSAIQLQGCCAGAGRVRFHLDGEPVPI
jgi:hypothetical protein